MERLTRPGVHVDESAAKCIGNETKIQYAGDRLLELILNGPTLMAFNKDKLRHMMRQLYARLEQYENTGVTPEEIVHIKNGIERVWKLMQDIDEEKLKHIEELVDAENEGRLVVLPCKVGDFLYEVDLPEYGVIVCEVLTVSTYTGPACGVRGNEMIDAVSVGVEVIGGHGLGSSYAFEPQDFGNIVFMTREEAEAALAADTNVGSKSVNDLYDEDGGEILGEDT